MSNEVLVDVSLLRRFAAILYDTFLLVGVLFIAGLPLPLIAKNLQHSTLFTLGVRVYLLSVCFVFFGWFWTHGGQTLGMRAWNLRLSRDDGTPVTWTQALQRFFAAMLSWGCAGLGFIWMLFSPDKLTWHDKLSHTRIVRLTR